MIKPEFAALREKFVKINSIEKIKNIHLFFSSNDKNELILKYVEQNRVDSKVSWA